jgi:hypothetical protein
MVRPGPIRTVMSPAARPEGSRVLAALPTRAPTALPSLRPAPVLRSVSQQRRPTQLPLFPTPGQLMAGKR